MIDLHNILCLFILLVLFSRLRAKKAYKIKENFVIFQILTYLFAE